jgi:hypothetical protein
MLSQRTTVGALAASERVAVVRLNAAQELTVSRIPTENNSNRTKLSKRQMFLRLTDAGIGAWR